MTASSTPRATRPLALIATAVVLVAFALDGWVPVGRTTDQTRPVAADPRPATDPGRAQAEKAGVDIDAVVDRMRHRVTPAEDGSGALAAHDEQYRARFDATGFGFTLAEHPSRFGVSLRGVQRGGHDLALVPGAWSGEANVAVRGLGSGMTERVTARAGELEWDVVLDRPLPGSGDLRVEADLRGLDAAPEQVANTRGWRFPLGDGGTARMGEVVVKDATGTELHRALPQVRGDALHLVVPASVLTGARYPLTIDPTVGPEVPVGGDPVYAAAPSFQDESAVAWNGANFLVVWQDRRAADIYGARVSAAGNVLDPAGIPISTAAGYQLWPAVASNGTDFLVVWEDQRAGTAIYDIYGARVTGAGSVLDPLGIPVSTAVNYQAAPAVAWNGSNFLVVWHDNRNGNADVFGARMNAAGSMLDPAGIPISTAVNAQANAAVAWDGTTFLVVWEDQRAGSCCDIYGARMNGAGTVLDPAGIAISAAANLQRWPEVASNGTSFLVVWQDSRSGTYDIFGARVSGAGSVLDPLGIPVSPAAGSGSNVAVASNGTDFLVVWSGVRGARVSGAGTVLDPAGISISTGGAPAVAWNGTEFLVVWQEEKPISPPSSYDDIHGSRVSGDGTVVDPDGILISTAASSQNKPEVAWNGTNFLVVWFDTRAPQGIYGSRVSGDGTVLDPAGIAISPTDQYVSLAVASNGTDFLVVWDRSGVRGARVNGAGTVLDPGGVLVSAGGGLPAVAWNGTDFLVAWEDSRSPGCCTIDLYGARVSSAGTVLDPAGIAISTAADDQRAPAVAWNGTSFLVVWHDGRSGTSSDIYGARVNGAGSVLDPAGIPISTAAGSQATPAVASWGDNFLVVWADRRSGTNYDIYGAGVGANGTVAQPAGIPISTAAGDQTLPVLAVRYYFLVAWLDRRSGTNDDIYATRVSPSGVVEEPNGVLVASAVSGPFSFQRPAVTGGPGATWRVASDRFMQDPPYGANRVFLRSVSPK